MATKTDPVTRTIGIQQRNDARTLINVAVRMAGLEGDHHGLHAEYSTLVRLASDLSGVEFDTIHEAVTEYAAAQREIAEREWRQRRGVQQYTRDQFVVAMPKWEDLRRRLF